MCWAKIGCGKVIRELTDDTLLPQNKHILITNLGRRTIWQELTQVLAEQLEPGYVGLGEDALAHRAAAPDLYQVPLDTVCLRAEPGHTSHVVALLHIASSGDAYLATENTCRVLVVLGENVTDCQARYPLIVKS